jgi:hypothetical protein
MIAATLGALHLVSLASVAVSTARTARAIIIAGQYSENLIECRRISVKPGQRIKPIHRVESLHNSALVSGETP